MPVAAMYLRYLLGLRLAAFGGLLLALLAGFPRGVPVAPPPPVVLAVLVGLGLLSWLGWQRHRRDRALPGGFVVGQLAADLLALTALLHFTEGASSPFVSLYLLPVTFAAASLSLPLVWAVAAGTAACYTALLLLPPPGGEALHPPFAGHVHGMWAGVLLSTALVAWFVAGLGRALRSHQRRLAEAREAQLRAHELASLGALAAGTAHELGTPLATIAVLARELERALPAGDERTRRRLQGLRSQVERCKETLARMAHSAGQARAEGGRVQTVDALVHDIAHGWCEQHPQRRLKVFLAGEGTPPTLVVDRTLEQALDNLLDNAAAASDDAITLTARWSAQRLCLEVRDRGPGLPQAVRGRIGDPFVSTRGKGEGLGLGVYLARTTAERLGGTLEIGDAPGGGVVARLTLPLERLAA